MQEAATLLGEAQAFLEQLTTTRGRVTMSVLVVVVTMAVAALVVPYAVRKCRTLVASQVLSGPVGDGVDVVGDYFPTTFTGVVLRTAQVCAVVGMTLALLVVWGMADLAVALLLQALDAIPDLFRAGVTAALVVFALVGSDQLRHVIAGFSEGADRVTEHQEEILLRVSQVTLFVTVTAAILTLWSVDLSGLLVGAGFLGIVVGLAARQTLGALIAGFVLMFSRPFTIGDWVEIDDNEGIVTDITIFNTRLENFDGEFVVIPNDRVSDSSLTNRSQKGLLRLRTDVGVDYETDVERASDVALEAMESVEHVVASPAPQVVPKAFGDSAIHLELRYWIDHPTPPRKWRAVSAVVQRVKRAFDEEDVTVPYPQRELSAREGTAFDAGGPGTLGDGSAGGEAGNGKTAESAATDPDD